MLYAILSIAAFVIVGAIYVALCTPTGDRSDDYDAHEFRDPGEWPY